MRPTHDIEYFCHCNVQAVKFFFFIIELCESLRGEDHESVSGEQIVPYPSLIYFDLPQKYVGKLIAPLLGHPVGAALELYPRDGFHLVYGAALLELLLEPTHPPSFSLTIAAITFTAVADATVFFPLMFVFVWGLGQVSHILEILVLPQMGLSRYSHKCYVTTCTAIAMLNLPWSY